MRERERERERERALTSACSSAWSYTIDAQNEVLILCKDYAHSRCIMLCVYARVSLG
jgi:hypothetical protein